MLKNKMRSFFDDIAKRIKQIDIKTHLDVLQMIANSEFLANCLHAGHKT